MKGVGVAFARFLNVPFDTGVLIGIGIVFWGLHWNRASQNPTET